MFQEQEKEKATTDVASAFETQEICLDLEKVAAIDGEPCTGGYYLRTTQPIPKILEGNQPRVYPIDYYQGINISYVTRGPDLHLYLNSSNPQFLYLKKLRMSAVFEDIEAAAGLLCDNDGTPMPCDVLDMEFPIRDYLVPLLIEMVVKDLTGAKFQPVDSVNNAADDLSNVRTQR